MRKVRGFTLLELMIVVAIIAILATIAYSSYNKQVRKSRRAEARQALSDMALRQEKRRANNTTYGTCDNIFSPSTCATFNGTLNYYTVAVTANTATGFTMTATPKGDQANDSTCGTFTFTMANGVLQKTATGTTASCY